MCTLLRHSTWGVLVQMMPIMLTGLITLCLLLDYIHSCTLTVLLQSLLQLWLLC